VKKVMMIPKKEETAHKETLSLQDRENINSLVDMFSGEGYDRIIIESVYNQNDKNTERVVDMILNGKVSKQKSQYQIVSASDDKPTRTEDTKEDDIF
jgi:hypothetical protein